MTGEEFEDYLFDLFRSKGYDVFKTPTSGDFGADLILEKNGIYTAVQIKRYSRPVGLEAVQEIVAALDYYACKNGMVVTNETFTHQAYLLAEANGIELWDGNRLKREIIIGGI